ncbi:MAG: hydrogenase maturation protease [Acidobacteria bacterium]|nr:hydrogenase maturation protease [Acidobacteriota bacterium]
MSSRFAVFGLGNVLLHDDAFGPQVISELRSQWLIPDDVVVEDLGTPGLELSTHLAGHRRVILVDAVAADGSPGTLVSYDKETIVRHPTGIRLGPHDPSLGETLLTMDLVDDGPREVVLFGAIPASTEPGIGLSDEVRSAATQVADDIVQWLRDQGIAIAPRESPVPRIAWWETPTEFEAFRVAGNQLPDSH